MTTRTLFGVLLTLLTALPTRAASAPPTTRPNLILILADDLGARDLACTGSSFYETPNLDRLASQGALFTTAYAACPVCSPTRSAIMTGLYPARTGVTGLIGDSTRGKLRPAPFTRQLPAQLDTLPELLSKAGYVSWHVGKWHLGLEKGALPNDHGFSATFGGEPAAHSYFSPYRNAFLPDGPNGEYLTDRLTSEAISLIQHRDPSKPFFLNLWHHAPHVPLQAPAPLVEKYKKKAHDLGLDTQPALVEGENFPTDNKSRRHIIRRTLQSDPTYAAMIDSLDANIGRLLQTLDDLGIADNTVILFTSDNGGLATTEGSPTSNLPLRDGKGFLHEGGVRVPFILRWPGVTHPASICPTPVDSVDILPTFLTAAHLPVPPDLDGRSLLPLLAGDHTDLSRPALFWHYPHYGNQGGAPSSSLRTGPWKLIEFYEDHHLELYNLDTDPTESHNLAPTDPARAKELHSQLSHWRDSVHAQYPTPNPDHKRSN